MATASDLKAKVTKISTIVEYLEDEQINQIEKDILLQAVRDLYTDILLTKVGDSTEEKPVVEEEKTVVDETPVQEEKPTEPPVIAIPFDAGDFDFNDLLNVNNEAEQVDEPVVEIPEEVVDEPTPEVVEEPAEMEVQEEVALSQEESVEEEEPKPENEYFAQSESVSSDFDEADAVSEPLAEESDANQTAETFDSTAMDEPVVEPVTEEQPIETEEVAEIEAEENTEPVEEPIVEEHTEEIYETSVDAETVDEVAAEEPAIEEKTVEVAPEVVPEPAVAETPATPAEPIRQEPEPEKVITLGEQLGQSRQSSLNDRFASNKPAEGSYGLKPISDIKSSIPLGERFLFTRTLFSGSGALFESTVAALNGMSSMEEAEGYIRANFNWDMESSTVVDFMNIVRRRYL
ncbi:MAG: hypothetical protein IKK36_12975 [Bacteroidales bacterium]|nr:hypothetical protein [Bacteroidales bacterium]